MEAQLEPLVRVEAAEGLRQGPTRIEDRQHMGDASIAMQAELVEPANRHLKRYQPP